MFSRSIPLGDNYDWDNVSAKYKNGTLNVILPKKEGVTTTMAGKVDFSKNLLLNASVSNVQALDGRTLSTDGFSARNVPLVKNGNELSCDITGQEVKNYVALTDIIVSSSQPKSVNWENARLRIIFN